MQTRISSVAGPAGRVRQALIAVMALLLLGGAVLLAQHAVAAGAPPGGGGGHVGGGAVGGHGGGAGGGPSGGHIGGTGGAHVGGQGGRVGAPPAGGAHQHLDSNFAHNRYYFNHGYSVHSPPAGGVGELRGRDGGRYWYHGGNWYRWRGNGWVIWGAPIGLYVPLLPPYYTTVWWNGVPYYYANDTYYLWDAGQDEYEVVAPPEGIETDGTTEAPAGDDLFVYPKNGQSTDQQAKDRFDCRQWAVSQTGYDPAAPHAGVAADQLAQQRAGYLRAEGACLEARGYSVK